MVKKFLIIAIVAAVIYSTFLFILPYYHYYVFKSDLTDTLKVSVADRPEDVMEKILHLVESYKIPVEKDDIDLIHKKQYSVIVSWHETVDFFTLYQKTFNFHIDTRNKS